MNMLRNLNISDNILGSGSYATVFKGTMLYDKNWRDVAVKKISNHHKHKAASAQKEYDVLSHLKSHKNIIQLLDMKTDDSHIYLVMEYAEFGDLDTYVVKNIPKLEEKIKIMLETATGIHYMHSLQSPVIHRDIKPGNILMQSSPQGPVVKICDYGLAKIFNPEATSMYMSTDAGTPMYRAPEQFVKGRQQYTSAVDVFSLGLVYMGLLNVSTNKPKIECIPESLYESDMTSYAQHLKMALQYKAPMPALFTLNSADKWPERELKGVITHMTAFEATDRMKIGEVEETLQTMMSAYGSSTSSAGAQPRNPVNRKDKEISELSTLLTDVLQDKEQMKQRHEQEKERYEQMMRETEEQLALAYQQKPAPSTFMSCLRGSSKEEPFTLVKQNPSTSKILLSPRQSKETTQSPIEISSLPAVIPRSSGKSTVMSKLRTLFKQQNPGPSTSYKTERSPLENKGSGKQTAEKTSSPEKVTPASSSPGKSQLSSFRNNVPSLHRLSSQSSSLVKEFKLRNKCGRFCYHDNSMYFCCWFDDCIDVYSMEGEFIRTLALGDISKPRALHPLSAGRLVLAAGTGLFVMGGDGGEITCVKQGEYQDVHVNGSNMVTLKNYDSAHESVESDNDSVESDSANDSVESDSVCVLSTTAPYIQKSVFTLGHRQAFSVLLHQDTVYVSDWDTHHVTGYSLTGEQLSQWGGVGTVGGPGKLDWPCLCATDSSGRMLVADLGNSRLQLVTAGGEWAVVPGVEVRSPTDVILLTDRMWVIHGVLGDRQIYVYKLVSV